MGDTKLTLEDEKSKQRARWPGFATRAELATRWGISEASVKRVLAAHGIEARPPRGQVRPLLVSMDDVQAIESDPF